MTLLDRLDHFAEWWEHEKGDKLVGAVVDTDTRTSEYGVYPIITVRISEDGSTEKGGEPLEVGTERAFHASSTVARNEIEKKNPQIGDTLAVAYHGIPEGKEFKLYKLIVERSEPLPSAEPVASGQLSDDESLPF